MEEWIGERWHRLITCAADASFAAHAVALPAMERSVGLLFRAAGGAPGIRVVPAAQARIGGPRSWLQRIAGSGMRAAVSRLDGETLALPPVIAVFDDASLNRDLYLWLAALAAVHVPGSDWVAGNRDATALALQRCPGLVPKWQRLLRAHLAQRPSPANLKGPAALAEATVQSALGDSSWASADLSPSDVSPVWLWLEALPTRSHAGREPGDDAAQPPGHAAQSSTRRRTQRAKPQSGRAPMLLPSRAESLMTWSEHVPLDRASDDEDDGQATAAADDMEQLTLSRDGAAPASRVKFDLDLPSASADDRLLGLGVSLPE